MSADNPDYKLNIAALKDEPPTEGVATSRPFLSVLFECCGVYQRIYRDPRAQEYRARCPRCGLPVRFIIGEGGTTARFFRVT